MEEERSFLILSQNDIFEALTAAWDSCQSARKVSAVQAKIIRVDELKTEFDLLRREILKFNSKNSDKKDQIETKTNAFNSIFEAIYGRFLELKQNQEDQSSRPQCSNPMPMNLQPLKLIHFNGELEKWQQFKTLYDSLIHENTSLPKIQKLHYLKAHVFGDAAALIQNIEIQEENYELCYDLLVERYSSPRRLINFYTGQLLRFDSRDSRNYDRFLMVHLNAVKALKNLKLVDLADCLLFQLSYRNLAPSDRQAFDSSLKNDEIPSTEDLFAFLKRRLKTDELQVDLNSKTTPRTTHGRFFNKRDVSLLTAEGSTSQTKTVVCGFCKGAHRIYTCTAFLDSSVADRKKFIKQNRKCRKCLGNHSEITCLSEAACKDCNSKDHHTYLHDSYTKEDTVKCLVTRSRTEGVLLGTIQIRVKSRASCWMSAKCILDSASQVNLITTACARKLGLTSDSIPELVSGVSEATTPTFGSLTCEVDVGPRTVTSNFKILNTICSPQPNVAVPETVLRNIKTLELADEEFYKSSTIEILLGAELVSQLISNEEPVVIPGEPTALRTHYGYVLFGKMNSVLPNNYTILSVTSEMLNNELRRFWEVEEVKTKKCETPEDIFCEDLFTKTHSRDKDGRYQVRLPVKPNGKPLCSNRDRAYASYIKLENRLSIQPEVKDAYNSFLSKYLEMDYMEIANTASDYIHTHHAVFKESSSTSLRVVFNGSTPDSNGNSLNSILYTGPKLQASLPEILDNFRYHKFVIVADISKMFNQILIHPEHRKLQHLFWRPPGETKVREYELKRLSFGHVSSPWLALRVLRQLVTDEGQNYPRAVDSLSHWTYVDDIITGVNSVEQGQLMIRELVKLLEKGGFQLKKWISNCPELLSEFSTTDLETPRVFKDETSCFKVLGITWLPDEDVFSFNCSEFSGPITKRTILTFIARLFDPCGWCSPVILKAKIFIQKCWLLGVSWDEVLPNPLASQWSEFVSEFHLLSNLKIPRNMANDHCTYRLLGFSDGSSEGYGCCVYLQIINRTSSKCHLLRAKSKVCPLKTLSIPRIELLAAHTLVKLVESITHEHFPFLLQDIFYFTDSEIVLHWISSSPHSLKTFVANRVSEIQTKTVPSQWRHINSEDNPSDPISRGLLPSQLLRCSLYWNGPICLKGPIAEWPKNPTLKLMEVPELKQTNDCLNVISEDSLADTLIKYSSLTRVQNVFAYVLRYIHNLRNSGDRLVGPLSVKEKRKGLLACARITQMQYFREEFQRLRQKKQLSRVFTKLTPFIDEKTHLIRAGGRLRNSELPFNSKHPIILPKASHLSKLICDFYHVASLHSGVNTVQSMIIKNWWIFSLRSLLRKRIFSCIKCYRLKPRLLQPHMADLPASRVCISRPFTHVGTDFCGPFIIKESRRRNAKLLKAYLCVFVCFTTKAVHLEVVTELSTAAFLACFDRFVSRRSLPSCVYSDNGTNYQGAHNQLKEIQSWLQEQKEEIYSQLANRKVEWKFSPPNAPNFGGLWESVVKSAKTLLVQTIGKTALTFEELATVFTKIEAIMNSRPLTPLTPTPDDDLDFLTPGHFLVGGSLVGVPETDILESVTPSTRWTELKRVTQHFWKRWSQGYLHTLTQRPKWGSKRENIKEGQLVYMTRLNTSPLSWPLGRITATHPGKDGTVRVATVKTAAGAYLRPVNSLLPFPPQM